MRPISLDLIRLLVNGPFGGDEKYRRARASSEPTRAQRNAALPIGLNSEWTVAQWQIIGPKTANAQRGHAGYIAANAGPLSLMMREFNPPWRRIHVRTWAG